MTAADAVFLVLILYGLIFGLRRGFYKELVSFTSFILAGVAARTWGIAVGELLHEQGHFPAPIAHIVGPLLVGVGGFFIFNVIGRLILKKIRNPDAENAVEGAAKSVADAAGPKTKAGPITMITNPIAHAHRSVIYWSDKLLGGVLGVVKGAVIGYAAFGVIYFVNLHMTSLPGIKGSFEASYARQLFSDHVAGILHDLPEDPILENAGRTEQLVDETKGEPQLIDRLAAHKAWAAVKATPAFAALAADPEIKGLWVKTDANGKRDLQALLVNPKVRELLADAAFRDAFALTDVEAVFRSLAPPAKQE